jgi:hypothetical protein
LTACPRPRASAARRRSAIAAIAPIAAVASEPHWFSGPPRRLGRSTRGDAEPKGSQGAFQITGVPAGVWDVLAEAQAGALRGRARKITPDATVEIQATGVTSLDGTAHGPNGPSTLFTVGLDGPSPARRTFGGADGTFSFARLDAGDYVVRVTSSDGNGEVRVTVVAGAKATVDVALAANAIVVGKLTDPAGRPISDVTVAVVPDTGDGRIQVQFDGPPPTTGPDGTFRVEAKAGKAHPARDDAAADGEPQDHAGGRQDVRRRDPRDPAEVDRIGRRALA